MSLITPAVAALKRVVGTIASLLPQSPPTDAPPPDIDGKRQADLDPAQLRRVELARKDGKGGYR